MQKCIIYFLFIFLFFFCNFISSFAGEIDDIQKKADEKKKEEKKKEEKSKNFSGSPSNDCCSDLFSNLFKKGCSFIIGESTKEDDASFLNSVYFSPFPYYFNSNDNADVSFGKFFTIYESNPNFEYFHDLKRKGILKKIAFNTQFEYLLIFNKKDFFGLDFDFNFRGYYIFSSLEYKGLYESDTGENGSQLDKMHFLLIKAGGCIANFDKVMFDIFIGYTLLTFDTGSISSFSGINFGLNITFFVIKPIAITLTYIYNIIDPNGINLFVHFFKAKLSLFIDRFEIGVGYDLTFLKGSGIGSYYYHSLNFSLSIWF